MSNFFDSVSVPKIIEPIVMREYHESMKNAPSIFVWVNPSQAVLDEYGRVQAELRKAEKLMWRSLKNANRVKRIPVLQKRYLKNAIDSVASAKKRNLKWFANIWSQGEESTHVSYKDVQAAQESITKEDAVLWAWIIKQTTGKILAHNNIEILSKN